MKITLQKLADRTAATLKEDNISDIARIVHRELARSKKLNQLDRFIKITKQKYYQKERLVLAEVTSAATLSESELAKLKAKIEKRTGRKIALDEIVDPQAIGGIKIRIEDEVIDMSYRGLLERLNSRLGGGI